MAQGEKKLAEKYYKKALTFIQTLSNWQRAHPKTKILKKELEALVKP